MTQKGYKPKQAVTHFYCRPCKEYHEKAHPHHADMLARREDRQRKQREAAERRVRMRAAIANLAPTR